MRTRLSVVLGLSVWLGVGACAKPEKAPPAPVKPAASNFRTPEGALDYAAEYVKQRKQFGKPIAELQGVQFMLADMGMKIAAARQLTYAAAHETDPRGELAAVLELTGIAHSGDDRQGGRGTDAADLHQTARRL